MRICRLPFSSSAARLDALAACRTPSVEGSGIVNVHTSWLRRQSRCYSIHERVKRSDTFVRRIVFGRASLALLTRSHRRFFLFPTQFHAARNSEKDPC